MDNLVAENTDYAIMINGDWGCGKTYYIRHCPDNSSFSLSDEEKAFFKRFDELIDEYFSKTKKRPIKSTFLFYLNNKIKSILKGGL